MTIYGVDSETGKCQLVLNEPLSRTMRLIYALVRAGRPCDLLLLVHEGHNDVATSSYAQERLAQYLIEQLKP